MPGEPRVITKLVVACPLLTKRSAAVKQACQNLFSINPHSPELETDKKLAILADPPLAEKDRANSICTNNQGDRDYQRTKKHQHR